MKISRDLAGRVRGLLDEWLPPVLRDRRWAMWLPFRIVFGPKAAVFLDFKERALHLSEDEFAAVYRDVLEYAPQRATDLNDGSLAAVIGALVGETVLEVGCGKGHLASRMTAPSRRVTACDIVIEREQAERHPDVRWVEGSLLHLPFDDASFDTVVCTHTLEHVQDLRRAIDELRRVTRRRLVVVVPRQRQYRYTFDLHLHFFPYEHSLLAVTGTARPHRLEDVGGDWVYVEDAATPVGG